MVVMGLQFCKCSATELVSRINETPIPRAKRFGIGVLNYPATGGGYQRYPWYPIANGYWKLSPAEGIGDK